MKTSKFSWRKILKVAGLVVVIILLIRACMWSTENDIRQAAYEHSFSCCSPSEVKFIALKYGVSVISDSILEVPPSIFLVKRFRGHISPVKSISESSYNENDIRIEDKKTGKPGIVFYTGAIWWVSGDTVKIEAGYYEGSTSASGNILTLKRKNGRWVVIRDKVIWVS